MIITVVSIVGIVLGLAGSVPHITTMWRNRSSAGQSPVAWSIGITVNLMMGFVNGVGYSAELLVMGNVIGGMLCLVALALVMRLPKQLPTSSPGASLVDMPTMEFVALKEAVLEMEAQRQQRKVAA